MNSTHDYSTLTCCCTLEWLDRNGTVKRTVRTKTGIVTLVRNEFRDLFITVASKETNQKLLLKGVVIHKKFASEGKATLKFSDLLVNLFLSNAPPTQLTMFLKALFVKMTNSLSSPKVPIRDKLLSVRDQSVQDVSPLSSKDVQRFKNSQSSQDDSKKRLREEESKGSQGVSGN